MERWKDKKGEKSGTSEKREVKKKEKRIMLKGRPYKRQYGQNIMIGSV